MRIAFDATSIGSGQGGDETCARGLVQALATTSSEQCTGFDLVVRDDAVGRLPRAALDDRRTRVVPVRRRPGAWHFARTLPHALTRMHPAPDALVALIHAPWRPTMPTALLVPDLSFLHHPEHYPWMHRERLQRVVGRQVHQADIVITVSEFSRQDIITTYGLPPGAVHVVPLVIESPGTTSLADVDELSRLRAVHGIGERFILALGNLHPRKNLFRIMRAFLAARAAGQLEGVQLVIAGGTWWNDAPERALAAAHPHDIVMVGRVSDAARDGLLRSADALVYVSLFEGFGLPPLEAMIRGTPALVSNTTALPEATGGTAMTVDPTDVDAIRDALVELVDDGWATAERRERARAHAAAFTPANTGRALEHALRCMAMAYPRRSARTVIARSERLA